MRVALRRWRNAPPDRPVDGARPPSGRRPGCLPSDPHERAARRSCGCSAAAELQDIPVVLCDRCDGIAKKAPAARLLRVGRKRVLVVLSFRASNATARRTSIRVVELVCLWRCSAESSEARLRTRRRPASGAMTNEGGGAHPGRAGGRALLHQPHRIFRTPTTCRSWDAFAGEWGGKRNRERLDLSSVMSTSRFASTRSRQ